MKTELLATASLRSLLPLFLVVLWLSVGQAEMIDIPTVLIGDPGNRGVLSGAAVGGVGPSATVGSVDYIYRIGKYEVTNREYTAFLNAVDPEGANRLQLYHGSSATQIDGGILRNLRSQVGARYEVRPGRENRPVVFVSYINAIRFANWMHNGQGHGDTESGAYTLLGDGPVPVDSHLIVRNPGAKWFIPTEDEWVKAAYYDRKTESYFQYAVQTNSVPSSDQPPGDSSPDPQRVANFYRNDGLPNGFNDGYAATGKVSYDSTVSVLTDVGAYTQAAGPYGTFDQMGNVGEWVDYPFDGGMNRGLRGGSAANITGPFADALALSFRGNGGVLRRNSDTGFRIATVPEPATGSLVMQLLFICSMHESRRRLRIRNAQRVADRGNQSLV